MHTRKHYCYGLREKTDDLYLKHLNLIVQDGPFSEGNGFILSDIDLFDLLMTRHKKAYIKYQYICLHLNRPYAHVPWLHCEK